MLRQMFARFVKPSSATGKASGGVAAAVVALAIPFLMQWEGKRNYAYLDTIANPPVWTVCYGQTGPRAYEGAYYTDAECMEMLTAEVWKFYNRMDPMMTNREIPVSVQFGLLELMYNVGDGNFRTSTILRLANEGKYREACLQLDRWVKAGGVTVRGLVNRRNASEEMCMKDMS